MTLVGHSRGIVSISALALLLSGIPVVRAGDWPMWRHDAGRSAATDEVLPDTLHLQWVHEYPQLEPAWPPHPDEGTLTYDVSYKPVVMGKQLFVGASANHSLTAIDTDTGKEQWRFYADGPIRFAPVASNGRVFVGSDDGFMYCLKASDGSVMWKYRPGPDNRKIIGNDHLCGLWPVRGGAVLHDGILYFGASIWPFMGTFICALNAETGAIVWENSGEGVDDFREALSPGSDKSVRPSIYGCVPQGYMAIAAGRLVVPQGRNLPRVYDLKTGKSLFNEVRGMHPGHSGNQWFALAASNIVLFSATVAGFTLDDWHALDVNTLELTDSNPGSTAVTARDGVYVIPDSGSVEGGPLLCLNSQMPFRKKQSIPLVAQVNTPGSYIKAGRNVYLADKDGNLIVAKDVDGTPSVEKGPPIPGKEVWDVLAADGKLFTVSRSGKIACFGGKEVTPTIYAHAPAPLHTSTTAAGKGLPGMAGSNGGYCVVLGLADGNLVKTILGTTAMNVVAVDSSPEKIGKLRREVDAAGLYGKRLTAYVATNVVQSGLPPYLASLVVSETMDASALGSGETLGVIYGKVRPYGGRIFMPAGKSTVETVNASVVKSGITGAGVAASGDSIVVTRRTPPPGAANKTHSNGDAANTMMSADDLVRPPFGLLWFGGPSNDRILPRHGHGPSPQLCDGVLVIEGPNLLRALDVYTGRLVWERDFPGLGRYFDTGGKQLGAHAIGDNYVTVPDGVYVITPEKCLQLDLNTGRTKKEIAQPSGIEAGSTWGAIRVEGDALVAVIGPTRNEKPSTNGVAGEPGATSSKWVWNGKPVANGEASAWLAVIDRHSGKALWTRKADYSWGNLAFIAGAGKVFASDKYPTEDLAGQVRRGEPKGKAALYAFDIMTGKTLWRTEQNLSGAWLAYSAKHDVLIQAGRGRGEGDGYVALKASDGSRIWESKGQSGPPMLIDEDAVPQFGPVVKIADGTPSKRINPLTGRMFAWGGQAHGCSFNSASKHLVYMRAGGAHAGYMEVKNGFGINCLNGFRSSCTANATAGGGVLVYPDYTRDCRCQFENQTSLALIHMPEVEKWAFDYNTALGGTGIVKRVGLNCAGPGDRLDDNGTFWLDCPAINGPGGMWSDYLKTSVDSRDRLRCHPSRISGDGIPWVLSSALIGAKNITAAMGGSGKYTVRLSFAELDPGTKPGERVFDVALQGKQVLSDMDVVREAGAPHIGLVKEFKDVQIDGELRVGLTPKAGNTLICGVEALLQGSEKGEKTN